MPRISLKAPSRNWSEPLVIKRKLFLLFLFLLGYLVLYPYAQDSHIPYLSFRLFGVVVTVLSVYAVSFRRSFALIGLMLAGPALIQRIALPQADANAFAVLSMLFSFSFDVFIIVVIFRRVFAHEDPTSETIFGALCIYLLVGFSFTGLYGMVTAIQPRAFHVDPLLNAQAIPDRFDLIYYSFGTLTSLGAPGIAPISDSARSLSVIESILGVLYLAVLISRLMNAYRAACRAARAASGFCKFLSRPHPLRSPVHHNTG